MSALPFRRTPQEGAASNVVPMTTNREPFAKLPLAILTHHRLSMGARCCYALLRHYARDDNTCFPAEATLAQELGVSERTVRSYLDDLDAIGALTIEVRHGGQSNVYTLCDTPAPPPRYRKKTAASDKKLPEENCRQNRKKTAGSWRKKSSTDVDALDQKQLLDSSPEGEEGTSVPAQPPPPPPHTATLNFEQPTLTESPEEQRARGLLATLRVPATEVTIKAMAGVVTAWGERCARSCSMSIEDKALDMRAWLDSPRGQKQPPTVQRFRRWVQKDTQEAESAPLPAPRPVVTPTGGNGTPRAAPAVGTVAGPGVVDKNGRPGRPGQVLVDGIWTSEETARHIAFDRARRDRQEAERTAHHAETMAHLTAVAEEMKRKGWTT